MAQKRLQAAHKHLKSNEQRAFYDEVTKAIWGYLGDKLHIQTADLTKDRARDVLTTQNIDPLLSNKLLEVLDECEMALFAPSITGDNMQKMYDQSLELITELDQTLKKG